MQNWHEYAENKLFHLTKLFGLDKLNLSFVHYKKIMKIQFLKYGTRDQNSFDIPKNSAFNKSCTVVF